MNAVLPTGYFGEALALLVAVSHQAFLNRATQHKSKIDDAHAIDTD